MIMNTNSTNKENENPYGHLLDKYLDSKDRKSTRLNSSHT